MRKITTFIEEEIVWRLERYWEDILFIPKQIKWFIQRGRRGYSDADLWDFQDYLRRILAGGLKQFAKKPMGWPDHGEAKTYRQWKKILKDMAGGFQAVIDYEDRGFMRDNKHFEKSKIAYKKQEESLKLLAKWFNHLWD